MILLLLVRLVINSLQITYICNNNRQYTIFGNGTQKLSDGYYYEARGYIDLL